MAARRKPSSTPQSPGVDPRLRLIEDDRTVQRFLALLRVGLFVAEAARAVRWSEVSVARWIARGEASLVSIAEALDAAGSDRTVTVPAPDEPYASFAADVRQAQAEVDATLVGSIRKAAQDPRLWQAAAWLLAKRNPKVYGTHRLEVAGDQEAPLLIAAGHFTPPDLMPARAAEVLEILALTTGDPSLSSVADSVLDPD